MGAGIDVTLSFSQEDFDRLDQLAQKNSTTVDDLLRTLIDHTYLKPLVAEDDPSTTDRRSNERLRELINELYDSPIRGDTRIINYIRRKYLTQNSRLSSVVQRGRQRHIFG